MLKKLIKPLLGVFAVLGVVLPAVYGVFTLYSARTLFLEELPDPGAERYLWLGNRLSVRVATDQKQTGLFRGQADIRIRIADGSALPFRVDVGFGPLLPHSDTLLGLASWRVQSRYDIGKKAAAGTLEGHASFGREVALVSRVLKGGLTLPFGAGRLALEDASLALTGSFASESFSLTATASGGRLTSPHQHVQFSAAALTAIALPLDWEDLGGRQQTPLSFARGEFTLEEMRLKTRHATHTVAGFTTEFDAKVFDHTLSLEVFGQVESLPVYSGEETGELGYSFLLSGVDRERLDSALRRDAELSRFVRRARTHALPEPIAGYRGLPKVHLWPQDPVMQQRLLALVQGGVDVYSNLKLTQADSTAQLRFNTEFEHLGEGNSMMSMRNWGELFDRTLADFSFVADHTLASWPPIADAISSLDQLGLIAEDKFGLSSSTFIREGEIKVNGDNFSVDEFLGPSAAESIPAVAALRRTRLRSITPNHAY